MSQKPFKKIVIFSGAGLSVESGLPTFRGSNGLWEGADLGKVCHISTWKTYREEVFDFYESRRLAYSSAEPNLAHKIIAKWENSWPDEVEVITQNIDLLLEKAGVKKVVHLHGRIDQFLCTACGTKFEIDHEGLSSHRRCPKCDSLKGVKPGVVFFGEHAPEYLTLSKIARSLTNEDLLIVTGTSMAVIPPERLMPRKMFKHKNMVLIDPNPFEEATDFFGNVFQTSASEGLLNFAKLHGLPI